MTAFAPPTTATPTSLRVEGLHFFFFGQDNFNGEIWVFEHFRQIHQLAQDVHDGTTLGRTTPRKLAGFGVLHPDQMLGLGNRMDQYYRAQIRQHRHLASQSTEAGGLDFVNDTITNHIGNETAKRNFCKTGLTQIVFFQRGVQCAFVQHANLCHWTRLPAEGLPTLELRRGDTQGTHRWAQRSIGALQ